MTFTVETGSGVTGANSYATVAELRAYWEDRGQDLTGSGDASVQVALVNATDYVEIRYGQQWIGSKGSTAQGLHFPAVGAVDTFGVAQSGVPARLKNAVIEYAFRALTAALAPDPATDVGQTIESAELDVLRVKFDTDRGQSLFRAYPLPDSMIQPLLRGSSRSHTVIRH